jgi:hypothetical protein
MVSSQKWQQIRIRVPPRMLPGRGSAVNAPARFRLRFRSGIAALSRAQADGLDHPPLDELRALDGVGQSKLFTRASSLKPGVILYKAHVDPPGAGPST